MKIIDGKKIAKKIRNDLKDKVGKLKTRPRLAVILVGNDRASQLYVALKKKAAKKLGIVFIIHKFPQSAKQKEVTDKIKKLNADEYIDAILVQLPLPRGVNADKVIAAIDPTKDADGFHPVNQKTILGGKIKVSPVFPEAIIRLIKSVQNHKLLTNKKTVVIANSKIFGEVMKAILENEDFKGDYILAKNINKKAGKIRKADIVITACGRAGMIKGKMIKKGAIIIDGGISQKNGQVVGDIDFNSVKNIAGYISPVPGGVGPVTVAMLMDNVYKLALNKNKNHKSLSISDKIQCK